MSLRVAGAFVGAAAIAVAALLDTTLPGTTIPQTAQTLAVVLVGGVLGARMGAISAVLYVVLGVVGVPVFAGGEAGLERLAGPTGGYLVGFGFAAATAGWWVASGRALGLGWAVGGMVIAHVEILVLGWAWLSLQIGAGAAFGSGVAPFILGAVVKSVVAGVVLTWVARSRERTTHDHEAA